MNSNWQYAVEHWQDITVFIGAVRSSSKFAWMKSFAPLVFAAALGGLVSVSTATLVLPERMAHINQDVAELRTEVHDIKARIATNTEIILRNDERTARIQVDLTNILQMHQVIVARLDEIDRSGATRCLQCHMKQWQDHPIKKKPPLP